MTHSGTHRLLDAITHPITAVTGALVSILHFANIPLPVVDALAAVVWNNAGLVFTAVSVGGSTFAQRFGWLSAGAVNALMLTAGALFLAKIADTLYDKIQERLDTK